MANPTPAQVAQALAARCEQVAAWLVEDRVTNEQAAQCGPVAVAALLREVATALSTARQAALEEAAVALERERPFSYATDQFAEWLRAYAKEAR